MGFNHLSQVVSVVLLATPSVHTEGAMREEIELVSLGSIRTAVEMPSIRQVLQASNNHTYVSNEIQTFFTLPAIISVSYFYERS